MRAQVGATDEPVVHNLQRPGNWPSAHRIHGDGYVLAGFSLLILLGMQTLARDVSTLPLWLPLFFFVLGVMGIVRASWVAATFLSFPAWSLLGALLSNRLIEEGSYISEQFRTGFAIGATNLLALYALTMLLVVHVIIASSVQRWVPFDLDLAAPRIDRFARLVCFALLGVLAAFAVIIVMYGIATDADRFGYWNSMQPQMRTLAQGVRSLRGPLTAVAVFFALIASQRSLRRSLVLLTALMQIPLWLMGDKFSPFIGSLMAAATGLGLAYMFTGRTFRMRASYAFWVSIAAAATFTALVQGFSQMVGSSDSDDAAFDAILGRTVLQGHVWFGILDRWGASHAPLATLQDLIADNSLASPTGLDHLSYLVSRPEYVSARLHRGVTFTMGGPASPLALVGPSWGLLVFALMGCLYALQFLMIVTALRQGRYFLSAVGFVAYIPLHSVVLMGNWFSIYNIVGLVVLGAAVLLLLNRRRDPYTGKPAPLLKRKEA